MRVRIPRLHTYLVQIRTGIGIHHRLVHIVRPRLPLARPARGVLRRRPRALQVAGLGLLDGLARRYGRGGLRGVGVRGDYAELGLDGFEGREHPGLRGPAFGVVAGDEGGRGEVGVV